MNTKALLASGMIVAGAALVAAPWVLGQRIEADFREGMAAAGNASLGTPVRATLVSYERGFWNSTARSRFEIIPEPGEEDGDGKPKQPLKLDLDHRIAHGLGPSGLHYARVVTTLSNEQLQGSALARFFDGAQPLTVTLTVGLDGEIRGGLHSPAKTNALPHDTGEGEIAWGGLQGRFRQAADGQAGELDVESPGLQARGAAGSASLGRLAANARMHRGSESGLWLGDTGMEIERAEVQMSGSGFVMEDFKVLSDAREANGLVSSSVAWQTRRIGFGADTISDLALRLTISNLDAAVLKSFEDSMERPLEGSPEQVQQQIQAGQDALMKQLPRLLAKKPQMKIEQSGFKFNGAALDLGGKLHYTGDGKGPFSPADIAGEAFVVAPASILTGIMRKRLESQAQAQAMMSGDESVDASAVAEEGSRQMIDGLVQQGLLMAEADGRYRSEIKLAQGAVTINGLPFQGMPSAQPEAEAEEDAGGDEAAAY